MLGSARIGEGDPRWTEARRLGGLLAEAGWTVVTGGYGGLMAAVSRGAHERGGRVVGLPMRAWAAQRPNRWCHELRWAADYGARLGHLLRADAVVALDGGVGTLSEAAVVWAALQTEERAPALILVGEAWRRLLGAFAAQLVVDQRDLALPQVVPTADQVPAAIATPRRRGARPRG